MQKLAFSVILVAINIGIYWEIRQFDFVWRDHEIVENEAVSTDLGLAGIFKSWNAPTDNLYSPLTGSLFATISRLSSGSTRQRLATVFHSTSLALHSLNSILVLLILGLCLGSYAASFCGALVFALHPIQVEAVAWISSMSYVLGTFFALIAIWQYLIFSRNRANQARGSASRHYYLATAAYLLGTLAHPVVVVTPLLTMVLERLLPRERSLFQPKKPFWPLGIWIVLAVPITVFTISLQQTSALANQIPVWLRPLIVGDALTFYLYKLLLPFSIGPDYGRSPSFVLAHWWGYLIGSSLFSCLFFSPIGEKDPGRGMQRLVLCCYSAPCPFWAY